MATVQKTYTVTYKPLGMKQIFRYPKIYKTAGAATKRGKMILLSHGFGTVIYVNEKVVTERVMKTI